VVAFTYELFWWPARLALGVHAKHVMNNAWFYVDVVVDSFYLVDILIQMVEGIVKGEAAKKAAAAAYTGIDRYTILKPSILETSPTLGPRVERRLCDLSEPSTRAEPGFLPDGSKRSNRRGSTSKLLLVASLSA
jgi:hypothetical protein